MIHSAYIYGGLKNFVIFVSFENCLHTYIQSNWCLRVVPTGKRIHRHKQNNYKTSSHEHSRIFEVCPLISISEHPNYIEQLLQSLRVLCIGHNGDFITRNSENGYICKEFPH